VVPSAPAAPVPPPVTVPIFAPELPYAPRNDHQASPSDQGDEGSCGDGQHDNGQGKGGRGSDADQGDGNNGQGNGNGQGDGKR
jgi:hypothetical protein